MPQLKVIGEGAAEHENFQVAVCIVELLKSYMILVTDQLEFGIGTISLAAPSNDIFKTTSSSPFNIFGFKNNTLANLVSKTASGKLKLHILSMILIKEEKLKPKFITEKVIEALMMAIDSMEES